MTQIFAEFEVTEGSPPILEIEIVAVRGGVKLCGPRGFPINLPCRADSWLVTKTCRYPSPKRAACRASFDFGYDETKDFPHRERNGLVTYRATAVLVPSRGVAEKVLTQSVIFAALRRGAERDNGWKRMAIPMWWHMEQTLSKSVDLAFVPDRASPDSDGQPRWSYWQFVKSVEDLAGKPFLGSAGPSHLSLLRQRLDRFNLWLTPWGGRPGEEGLCDFDLSRRIRATSSCMDATVLLHNQTSRFYRIPFRLSMKRRRQRWWLFFESTVLSILKSGFSSASHSCGGVRNPISSRPRPLPARQESPPKLQQDWTESEKAPKVRFRKQRLFAREGTTPIQQTTWLILIPAVRGFDPEMTIEVEGERRRGEVVKTRFPSSIS